MWHVLPRFHAIGCVDKSDDLEYAEIIYYPDFVEDAKMYAWWKLEVSKKFDEAEVDRERKQIKW